MMTYAYSEDALEYAMDILGTAFDYSVNFIKVDGQEFIDLFLLSGIAKEFESGNPKYTAGMSGIDLAIEVFNACGKKINTGTEEYFVDYSPEYWCGWILSYYQWKSGISFKKILSVLNYEKLLNSYGVLHEADNSKSYDVFDEIVKSESFIARMRKKREFTQSTLAKASGVSIRSIQLYEQKRNNINKAQYNILKDIADVLSCEIEDILE